MFRSLMFYRTINLAVVLGVAAAAAVLTGALLVGDSVRESLRAITLERLGGIDSILATEHFVAESLAERWRANENFQAMDGQAEAAIVLRGGATGPRSRASRVQINGIEPRFARFFEQTNPDLERRLASAFQRAGGQTFPSAVINQKLAEELGIETGEEMVLSFENAGDIHRDSLYGRKKTADVVKKLRVTVTHIMTDEGMGRFGLAAGQGTPLNVFLPLRNLQRVLDQRRHANALFLGAGGGEPLSETALRHQLRAIIELEDLNLKIRRGENYFSIETPAFYLKQGILSAGRSLGEEMRVSTQPISSYLVNEIKLGERTIPYSLMTALDLEQSPLGAIPEIGGPPGDAEGALLNRWAADALGAELGDSLTLTYFVVGAEDELISQSTRVRLDGVLPMTGLGSDRNLAPDFPGIQDADDMSSWDPPFELDLGKIGPEDEKYWDEYHTAPKLFLGLQAGLSLWQNRFGAVTALRVGAAPEATLAQTEARFLAGLRSRIEPAASGLVLRDLKNQGLRAAGGATDFGMLFLSFSFFIIISAAILVGLFFRLAVERRGGELGIMLAAGYPRRAIRNRFLAEGLVLSTLGALLGCSGGFFYANLVMAGLRGIWPMGTSRLFFYFQPMSLAYGFLASVLVALIAIATTTRAVAKVPVTVLVAGETESPGTRLGRRAIWVLRVSLVLALSMPLISFAVDTPAGPFFGAGACLLIAGLAFLATRISHRRVENGIHGMLSMAARNLSRNGGRGLVCVSLVACACFVLVATGLYRNDGQVDADRRDSGTGGFFLEAQAAVPLHQRFSSAKGRESLGLDPALSERLAAVEIVSLRLLPGDDASCLNLFAPRQPRLLGVPDSAKLQGRFHFKAHMAGADQDPWRLLTRPLEDGAIPAIGDANSVMWILHSGLGKDFVVKDEQGAEVRLRFVGLVDKSIFQSELLISEESFTRLYPSRSGYAYFLLESHRRDRDALGPALEDALFDYGLDVTSTAAKISAFHEVENTYISIFQMLGGLGLILGTLGLAAIVYRNAMERKGELAAMRAFGFRESGLTRMLLIENAVLVILGIVIGTLSAITAMAPQLLRGGTDPSYSTLGLTLALVFAAGVLASTWAVRKTERLPLLAALRAK